MSSEQAMSHLERPPIELLARSAFQPCGRNVTTGQVHRYPIVSRPVSPALVAISTASACCSRATTPGPKIGQCNLPYWSIALVVNFSNAL